MPRPQVHPVDVLLDAARDLIIEGGPRAAGVRAIAKRSGAPSGSLYHQFGSRDGLVARAWLRAVRRFQAGYIAALSLDDPREAVTAAVRWAVNFALAEPADVRLLLNYSRRTLLDAEPHGSLAVALATVNQPLVDAIHALAERLFRSSGPRAVERTTFAVIDLPYAVLRRHLHAGTLTAAVADDLAVAVAPWLPGRPTMPRSPMKCYTVAETTIIDPTWVGDYVVNVTALVERFGGRYLARTGRVDKVEGVRALAQTFLIIEWPSKAAALSFYDSPEYRPYRQRRINGAENEFVLVAGEDATGAAHVDP